MAEEGKLEEITITTTTTTTTTVTTTEDMVIETLDTTPNSDSIPIEDESDDKLNANGDNAKRSREDGDESEEKSNGNGDDAKKQKVGDDDKSVEEQRLEDGDGGNEVKSFSGPVRVGPKSFQTSLEMFDYFLKFLHFWSPNVNVNEYEHLALLDLLKKGHPEPEKKIGDGIRSFQVRFHPLFKSRCFFIIREDDSVDDFSFRKCVDQILPLPENMKAKSEANNALVSSGGRGGGGRGRGGRGRGRGGNRRN